MTKRIGLALGLLCAFAVGCAEVETGGGGQVAQNNGGKIKKIEKPVTVSNKPMPKYGSVDQVVGTEAWHTGKKLEPKNVPLEKTSLIKGKVQSAGAGSVTVNLDNGGSKTVQVDDDTRVFRSGDPRFFAIEGGAGSLQEGQVVAIQLYEKNGQAFASTISVGTRQFGKNNNNDNNDN